MAKKKKNSKKMSINDVLMADPCEVTLKLKDGRGIKIKGLCLNIGMTVLELFGQKNIGHLEIAFKPIGEVELIKPEGEYGKTKNR